MKVKVAETTNIQLDWLVAKCEGWAAYPYPGNIPWLSRGRDVRGALILKPLSTLRFTTDWSQCGPIIERELIRVVAPSIQGADWTALIQHSPIGANNWSQGFGNTPMIATMRCFVASELGEEVEVPDELS